MQTFIGLHQIYMPFVQNENIFLFMNFKANSALCIKNLDRHCIVFTFPPIDINSQVFIRYFSVVISSLHHPFLSSFLGRYPFCGNFQAFK